MAMTKQEIFDRVARHLLTQKKHAMVNDACVYRTPDGLKCAIGCLIPNELYTPEIEGYSATKCQVVHVLLKVGISCIAFLNELQIVHDTYDVDDWAPQLRRVAVKQKLSYAVIDELS